MARLDFAPKVLVARYSGHCHRCQSVISRGDRVLYWPRARQVNCMGEDCGAQALRDQQAMEHDELVMSRGLAW